MAMPKHLREWWEAHPERWKQRPRHHRRFPYHGSLREQIDWFRRQFLRLAEEASSTKERAELLKLALTTTLKGEGAGGPEDALYREHLERMLAAQESRRNGAGKPLQEED